MITFLMIFFGVAILQAGIRMMAGHEISMVPFGACILGMVLIVRAVLRLLLRLAPKSAAAPRGKNLSRTATRADAPSES